MGFTALAEPEQRKLRKALRRNAKKDVPILMDQRDTSFVGEAEDKDLPDDAELIEAVKSIPCHY